MKWIHYILFLPLILPCGSYLYWKIKEFLPQKDVKQVKWCYIFTLLFMITLSILTLSYFLGFFFYTVFFFIVLDLFLLLTQIKLTFKKKKLCLIFIVFLSAITTIYGIFHALDTKIISYQFQIEKRIVEPIKIAFLSDVHLGTGHQKQAIDEIVTLVSKQNVDLLILGGDIFDENTTESEKEYAYQKLGLTKTKYGIFLIEGNHDLVLLEDRKKWQENGIEPLLDETILIHHQFYIIGRKDLSSNRKTVNDLLKTIEDPTLPIILIDHRPSEIDEISKTKIDIHLSGHTHQGQLFPFEAVMPKQIRNIGNCYFLNSSGYGTWGLPIRTSSPSAIEIITLTK